jgi:hypothetical protein
MGQDEIKRTRCLGLQPQTCQTNPALDDFVTRNPCRAGLDNPPFSPAHNGWIRTG